MNTPLSSVRGFTLIELMVVIVIMAIMASLVLMNIGGVDQRKAMQAREVFLLDLRQLNREANDQARIFALNLHTATDVSPARYEVLEYQPYASEQQLSLQNNQKWRTYTEFKTRILPEQVSIQILSLEQNYPQANQSDLLQSNAPALIWLGNGEAKPVRIQFYFEQRPVGAEIEVDHLGKIHES
ncbi:prepilin-type N-terminal cleavage/methylation domain-containing protein [Acinetobacter sp. A2]|uniref:prepilin-type N-terminal cleavage/methylation domain-containing protein n=1 Tax=Acinetobacter sp. A2 TaxID=362457 RepID=UPI0014484C32|nr:prepilin-type N-terminal cleavage/methylation domain-containing protein [Acinetobacter sp. A2]